jgi:hypothetical protein
MMAARVEFDEVMMFGGPDPGFNGLGFRTIDHWDDNTDSKAELEERSQGHGAFGQGTIDRTARVMAMTAFVVADDFRQAQRIRQELAAVFARDRILMRVTDDFSSSWRWVTILRSTLPKVSTAAFSYSIDILAVDPFRYEDADPVTTGLPTAGTGHLWPMVWPFNWGTPGASGRLTLSNVGTALAWPSFEVLGGIQNGFELEEVGTGRIIRYDQTLLIGSKAAIEPRIGTVMVDGVSRSTFLTRRDWFSVPPGGTVQVQFRALGDPFGTPQLIGMLPPTYV